MYMFMYIPYMETTTIDLAAFKKIVHVRLGLICKFDTDVLELTAIHRSAHIGDYAAALAIDNNR